MAKDKNKPAVFFDRDGVLVKAIIKDGKPFAANRPADLILMPFAQEAVKRLYEAGLQLFIVTNQPDIARGIVTLPEVESFNQCLLEALKPAAFQAVYTCPHDHQDACACRKPRAGMLLQAAKQFPVDLSLSFMVGDREVDIQAGRGAGCATVLIKAPYNEGVKADHQTSDLLEACEWILNALNNKKI